MCKFTKRQNSVSCVFTQFHLLPVIRDLTQFPFFSTDKSSGSAEFIRMIINSVNLVTDGKCTQHTF